MDDRSYVSCIRIGKLPIIPPLLSEECRTEMRYYRDLAVSLEKRRKCRRNSADSGVIISSNDGCQRKTNSPATVPLLPPPDTNKDLVSASGSSSNELMVSAEGSSGDSDHDNVFFEAEKICSPPRERRNSYTIQRIPDKETVSELHNSPTTASQSSPGERRNSYTIQGIPDNETVASKLQNSPTTASHSSPGERRNSYTIQGIPDNETVASKLQNSPTTASHSSPGERQNSYTIQGIPDNETVASKLQNSPTTASHSSPGERRNLLAKNKSPDTASRSSKIPVHCERQNSYTIRKSPSTASANVDVPVPRERRNSYTVQDHRVSASQSSNVPIPRERRNSFTIPAPTVTPVIPAATVTPATPAPTVTPAIPAVRERRNSYTLESPSPVMLQYIQSLEHHDPNKQCELFVESLPNYVPDLFGDQNHFIDGKELSLEDLVSNSSGSDDLKLSELGMWDDCSDETLHNFLKADLEAVDSMSSICGSPVSIIPAGNLAECLKSSSEQAFDAKVSALNRSCECICNAICNLEPLRSEAEDRISPKKFDNRVDDSFSRDFRYLDLSNFSCDSDCPEGRYSECSSVSLSKFLSGDKLVDGVEAELVAFSYMKEQLEQKHRDEFKRLLREQQREHDNLKAQFVKVSSLSKHTPSPKSNYAYSGSVLLKKYTPRSGQSTPLTSKSVDEQKANSAASKSNGIDGSNTVEVKKKTSVDNGKPPRPPLTVEQAASKINAAIRGYLTRRLFKTERVTHLVQTIKDCLATAVALQNEPNLGLSELDLQSRLLQQLTVACNDLHSTFSLPVAGKMGIIAADREKKFRLSLKRRTPLPLSAATRRTLERKTLANSAPPAQQKYDRKRSKSASSTASETNSCQSTPGSRRRLSNTVLSQKFPVPPGSRRPWR